MLLIRLMPVMAPVVLFINGYTKGDWWEMALPAPPVVVGLTSEMLPMTVTSTLTRGAVRLSEQRVIVKHLDTIQDSSVMGILCTDKTGTLTQDKIVLENHADISDKTSERVSYNAWLNSHYQTGLKNLFGTVVPEGTDEESAHSLTSRWQKINGIPFDFERRRVSVIVVENTEHHQLVCKGALQEILNACSRMCHSGETVPLDNVIPCKIKWATDTFNRQRLRVVAVVTKYLSTREGSYRRADKSGLILEGYITLPDPPRGVTAPAPKILKASGIAVKTPTGGGGLVAAKACHGVELDVGEVIIDSDTETLSDDELANLAQCIMLFARLMLTCKECIVILLKREGHVIGFMGDGINDVPALRAAGTGTSVGGAVDTTCEAADTTLLEKSLMVLEEGVIEGRHTSTNMLRYIKVTVSSNLGDVFSILVTSTFLPLLPMLPLYLFTQNPLYDVSQATILLDNVDDKQTQKPQCQDPADLGCFMVSFRSISSIFNILTLCLM